MSAGVLQPKLYEVGREVGPAVSAEEADPEALLRDADQLPLEKEGEQAQDEESR